MAAKTDIAGRRVKAKGEPQFANYADKDIPAVINEFVAFLEAETGATIDARSVYLGSALRGTFQKSEGNQKRIAERAAEIEQEKIDRVKNAEERAARKVQREADRKTKAEEKVAAAKEAAAEAKVAAAEAKAAKAAAPKVAPVKKAPVKAAAKTPAKPAAPARRRPAKPATEESDF